MLKSHTLNPLNSRIKDKLTFTKAKVKGKKSTYYYLTIPLSKKEIKDDGTVPSLKNTDGIATIVSGVALLESHYSEGLTNGIPAASKTEERFFETACNLLQTPNSYKTVAHKEKQSVNIRKAKRERAKFEDEGEPKRRKLAPSENLENPGFDAPSGESKSSSSRSQESSELPTPMDVLADSIPDSRQAPVRMSTDDSRVEQKRVSGRRRHTHLEKMEKENIIKKFLSDMEKEKKHLVALQAASHKSWELIKAEEKSLLKKYEARPDAKDELYVKEYDELNLSKENHYAEQRKIDRRQALVNQIEKQAQNLTPELINQFREEYHKLVSTPASQLDFLTPMFRV